MPLPYRYNFVEPKRLHDRDSCYNKHCYPQSTISTRIKTVEQTYNLTDIDFEQPADFYEAYESVDIDGDEGLIETHSSRRWTIWHVLILLLLVVLAALLVVYVVLPFVASLAPVPTASQLPTPVQA
jgi:hypothetical protein